MKHTKTLYILLILLGAILSAPVIHAQKADVWDGLETTPPVKGKGTADNPYIISNGAMLKWLQQNSGQWNKYYRQDCDIDLGNHELGCIGSSTGNSPFSGSYDGDGYAIKNFAIPMDLTNENNKTFGLFGHVQKGKIRNLIIDNASVAIHGVDNCSRDLRIGCVTGAVSPSTNGTVIENIIIKNSIIGDNGTNFNPRSLFAGGIAGDMANGFEGTANITKNNLLTLKNLYVNADIDFSKTERSNVTTYRFTQFNIGGILGRARRPNLDILPDYTFYSGQIKAPLATISPTWGLLRCNNAEDTDNTTSAYAGEVIKTLTTTNTSEFKTLETNIFEIYDKEYVLNANRLYSNYRIYDSSQEKFIEINEDFPSNDTPGHWRFGTRTLSTQNVSNTGLSGIYKNPSTWLKWQGVGHARYVADNGTAADSEVLEMFNSYVTTQNNSGGTLLEWVADETDGVYFKDRPGLELERTSFGTFTTSVSRLLDASKYKIVWTAASNTETDETELSESMLGSDKTCLLTLAIPDLYRTVTANLLEINETNLAKRLASRTFYIDNPELQVIRSSDLDFTATIISTPHDDGYKMKWYGYDTYGHETILRDITSSGLEETYSFGAISQLPERIKVELYTKDGTPIIDYATGNNVFKMIRITDIVPESLSSYTLELERREKGHTSVIVANVFDDNGNLAAGGYDEDYINEPDVTFVWEVNSDPSDVRGWKTVIQDPRNSWMPAYASEMYYRVTWQYQLSNVTTKTYGRSLIFLYDKEMTDLARAAGHTSFDGIDRWTDSDGIELTDEFPGGDDFHDGHDPYHAVKTLERAYELCNNGTSYSDNIIVVMGYYQNPNERYLSIEQTASWQKPVTIRGEYGRMIQDGGLVFYGSSEYPAQLRASTCFENIKFFGYDRTLCEPNQGAFTTNEWNIIINREKESERINTIIGYSTILYLNCNLHDLRIGENVEMYGYRNVSASDNLGLITGTKAPHVHVIGGEFNAANPDIPTLDDNETSGICTLTLLSGHYARVVAGSRNSVSSTACRVMGTSDNPCRVNININIPAGNPNPNTYTYDIALLVGGQTDGTIYADQELTIYNGKIGRFISGSISYGRTATGGVTPADSFFGSIVLTLKGGTMDELYGGSLGRYGESENETTMNNPVSPYFYGRSIININGCTINSNLYGAGSGGINGIGDDVHHTNDQYIPYVDDEGVIRYGEYNEAKGKTVKMTLRDGTILDFQDTYNEINILGGVIYGNVYGGGCGYSNAISINHAIPLLGNLYGNSRINVSQSGVIPTEIYGNIYGGGAGDRHYYDQASEEDKNKFENLASVYGDTHVNIAGGTIYGDVFGGAQGIKDFPDMACIYGDTYLNIGDESLIYGNVFGGCAFASIRKTEYEDSSIKGGNSNVLVEGSAIIGNNIFGGNQGDVGMDYNTEIEGNTKVEINDGSYLNEPYLSDGKTYRTFNTYGGGYNNCIVKGDTHVYISQSLLKDASSIGSNFLTYWNDLTHRRFCLYGGGYGEDTQVKGTANVNINILSHDVLVDPEDGIDFYTGKQIFDVAGGGYSGAVGSTNIVIEGNAYIRKVIGGGFFGSVYGNTNTHIKSGLVYSVLGGCMMGYVYNQAHLTIGTRGNDPAAALSNSTLWIVDNVYGGNDVQGIIGTKVSSIDGNRVDDRELTNEERELVTNHPYSTRILYQAEADETTGKGVYLNIYGGHIYGCVYGAGNGHYRGYYVPGWGRYYEGPERFYRRVPSRTDFNETGRVYKTRPTVGCVNMNIQGNSETDHVQIDEMVFGGGRDCTIGQWIPEMEVEDPRRLDVKNGGYLNMNFGSYVTVGGNVYMGSRGKFFGEQTVVPDGFDYRSALDYTEGEEVPNHLLDALGDAAYDHWYYDSVLKEYRLGFGPKNKMFENPAGTRTGQNPNDPDKSYFLCGEHQFYGYLKFIEMAAALNLTFYDEPWVDGKLRKAPVLLIDRADGPNAFDASNIRFNSFFIGGERGFMTYEPDAEHAQEFAYDICIPAGVTLTNKAVGGCEKSWIKYYEYKNNYHEIDKENLIYQLQGGLSVQSKFSDNPEDAYPKVDSDCNAVIEAGQRSNSSYALRLSVYATFDPQPGEGYIDPITGETDELKRYGGLVYGGCYDSGVTNGDVVLFLNGDLVGNALPEENDPHYESLVKRLPQLEYNIGRVFGGGYGKETEVRGDVHIYIIDKFRGVHVFGGGQEGLVTGQTNVNYFGNVTSRIYGSIYGGSLMSDVGDASDRPGSTVSVYSGNVTKVFGGSCLGNVYGSTKVYIGNHPADSSPHFDWAKVNNSRWGQSRIVIGQVFGGNDIAGGIITNPGTLLDVKIDVEEDPTPLFGEAFPSPGAHGDYKGFPLIGALYGGSNADYGEHDEIQNKYAGDSSVVIADGRGTSTNTIYLAETGHEYSIPNIKNTSITILGGTIGKLFGGGKKSTVTESTYINVNYVDAEAKAGFNTSAEAQKARIMFDLVSEGEFAEMLNTSNDTYENAVFKYQVWNVFGGNDDADMAIQPQWNLKKGHLGSVYSGGNFGKMTYYNPSPGDGDPRGLSITIDSADIHIESIYGGGRIGEIIAKDVMGNPIDFTKLADFRSEEDYGAKVTIKAGLIEAVYGGNDVSGNVHNGTNVNILGAISGDVYGAGNGNYLYKYDTEGTTTKILEKFDNNRNRYFLLPPLAEYGGTDIDSDALRDEKLVLAINSYRPNVDRSYLNIQGNDTKAWVKGNVYCGGNSSTMSMTTDNDNDIRFKIGSHVVLNGVFLGSNGTSLAMGDNIFALEQINGIDMTKANNLSASDVPASDLSASDNSLYKSVLDLYMRAVEVTNIPKDFEFGTLTDAYIGNFFIGGNRGSMMTDKKITITLPEDLIVYGHVSGGCNQSKVIYKGVPHIGGLTKPLNDGDETTKVHLVIKNKFMPVAIEYPTETSSETIILKDSQIEVDGMEMYPNGQCNIFGGCYDSGAMVGDIKVEVYSDMLDYMTNASTSTPWADGLVNKQAVVNGIDKKSWRAFDIIGGGYGRDTDVYGNINVCLMPGKASSTYTVGKSPLHPSAAGVFGGSLMGNVHGNVIVEVRDGTILTDVYGASESSLLVGSTSVMLGYPDYYIVKEGAKRIYSLDRADNVSEISISDFKNSDNSYVIPKQIALNEGDIVAKNVYEIIKDADKTSCFIMKRFQPSDIMNASGNAGVTWDDIRISIGDPYSRDNLEAPFYGHGNVYGGGLNPNNSNVTLTGQNTVVCDSEGYGGNSTVMVWDNMENSDMSKTAGNSQCSDGSIVQDHVSVGTLRYKLLSIKAGQDLADKYKLEEGNMIYIASGIASTEDVNADNIYEMETGGGVYGGGRTVFVEGFRSADIGYYGYAGHTPDNAKLLNTIQRADLVTIRDCCMMLQGASDFAISKVDNTLFSINRVGELRMISSINPESDKYQSDGNNDGKGMYIHTTPRQRNFIGFKRNVHGLAAFVSSVPFEASYHDADGNKESGNTYLKFKHKAINERESNEIGFKKRNLGTSPNMVGLTTGYSLRIQGYYSEKDISDPENADDKDRYYYGPVFGVTEVKLLSLGEGEGGGYIYALNRHYDSDYDSDAVKTEYGTDGQDFLFTTGNFVFPGAAYTKSDSTIGNNYIVDDCMPIGTGYDYHVSQGITDVNEDVEAHYWYIEGNKYTFNLNLTGYTSDSEENAKSFYLDNYDDIVLLPGITSGSEIEVESVIWSHHPERKDYDCDLTNEELNYNLFMTIDRDPELYESDTPDYDNAYIVELPRYDFSRETYISGVNPNDVSTQTAYDKIDDNSVNKTDFDSDNGNNIAALGIRLRDAVNNRFSQDNASVGRAYWENHLSDPHVSHITLTAKEEGGEEYTYVINLTIDYLLGPRIMGYPVIENCALPGEYIYANSANVEVDMSDTNMSVTSKNWYIFPKLADGKISTNGQKIDNLKVPGSDTEIRIPAYYYQNGWKIKYGVKANGEVLYSETDPASDHKSLTIHNYHRMRAFDGTHKHDLKLISGTRIYIEDQADFDYFLQYLDSLQYNPSYSPIPLPDGKVVHPQYCEGLDFYMQTDVTVPSISSLNLSNSILTFKGTLHGNGHRINLKKLKNLPISNCGHIYNVGFLSESNEESACVFIDNSAGNIENSYYYNTYCKGNLATDGNLLNCYQNTSSTPILVDGMHLLQLSSAAFRYGQVAYNLNGFYLKKRDLLLRRMGVENTYESLIAADVAARDIAGCQIPYIEDMFNNGDYRYAFFKAANQFKIALRTHDMPNYLDMMDLHRTDSDQPTQNPSHHDATHPTDPDRYCTGEHGVFHPIMELDDYLFFGQDLSVSSEESTDLSSLPELFTPDTRVYRISGFYSDKVDRGAFVNKAMVLHSPILTAVDFTGIRDNDPLVIADLTDKRNNLNWNGWLIKSDDNGEKIDLYYPPAIDAWLYAPGVKNQLTLSIGSEVSRNVLVYGHEDPIYNFLHYQDSGLPSSEREMALYDDSSIQGHHVVVGDGDACKVYGKFDGEHFLNLVDKHGFNAPIAFDYDELWYNRLPLGYSDALTDKSAWEGIYLPFTAKHVYAVSTSRNALRDHGEISHFYGDDETLHEYWLRRMTGFNKSSGKALFAKPKEENMSQNEDETGTLSFINDYFTNAYGNLDYIDDHNAYKSEHKFVNYRYLTAGVPYIITFPGDKYREFDMSGKFYAETVPGDVKEMPQTICYIAKPESTLEVTDNLNLTSYSYEGHRFEGTFRKITVPSDSEGKYFVIDEYNPDVDDGNNEKGEYFVAAAPGDLIMPFRTYIFAQAGTYPIKIGSASIDKIGEEENPENPDEESNSDEGNDTIQIDVENGNLIVTSGIECELPLYNLQGYLVAVIEVHKGINRYTDFETGIYIIHRKKVYLSPGRGHTME